MSKSKWVKTEILNYLSDGNAHPTSRIKEFIREKSEEEISEGVFAGCFRTLLLENRCESPERGIYMLAKYAQGVRQSGMCKSQDELKKKVSEAVASLEDKISFAMKGIDISEAEPEVLQYCIEIKKICADTKGRIEKANHFF